MLDAEIGAPRLVIKETSLLKVYNPEEERAEMLGNLGFQLQTCLLRLSFFSRAQILGSGSKPWSVISFPSSLH